ncbi:MAG: class III signal peptide-containing protein [Candidatus Anstonellaceae archaeon]
MKKAQTSVEYIILVAIILVIGLVVLTLSGLFPSFSFSTEAYSSKSYWDSAMPISIVDSYQSNSTLYLVLKNRANTIINISSIKLVYGLNEIYSYSQNIILFPAQTQNISISAKSCQKSQTVFYDITFVYSTTSTENLTYRGIKPLYILCQ